MSQECAACCCCCICFSWLIDLCPCITRCCGKVRNKDTDDDESIIYPMADATHRPNRMQPPTSSPGMQQNGLYPNTPPPSTGIPPSHSRSPSGNGQPPRNITSPPPPYAPGDPSRR